MLKTITRLNMILTLNKHGIDLGLLKDFVPDSLLRFCVKLEKEQTPREWYSGYPEIQKELIRDERFFFYLAKLVKSKLNMAQINSFVGAIRMENESPLDYPINRLISSMALSDRRPELFYDYLKHFSGMNINRMQKSTAVQNLGLYRKLLSQSAAELTEAERIVFTEQFLTVRNMVPNEVSRAVSLLARKSELMELMWFFLEINLREQLTIAHYEEFFQAPVLIYNGLAEIKKIISSNNLRLLMKRWFENHCPLYDLDVLAKKLKELVVGRQDDIFETRSSYINLVYGNGINNIPWSEIPKHQEDILIYAITNKKNSFLRLIEGNYETFSDLGQSSILFVREFFARNVNINSLSAKDLSECRFMPANEMSFQALEPDKEYTFKEIKALYKLPDQYLKLYTKLSVPRIDDKLIVLRELTGKKLLAAVTSNEQIDRLAIKLSEKRLTVWRDQNFSHIDGLKPVDLVELLIYQTEIEPLIPQMRTRTDARLVLRNHACAQKYVSIDEMKTELINIDHDWKMLVDKLEISNDFMFQHQERIVEFLCRNGAYIANTYYNHLDNDHRRESVKRIVKAELMGEFGKLKYSQRINAKRLPAILCGVFRH